MTRAARALAWWRHAVLGGLVTGLLASAHLGVPAGWLGCLLAGSLAVGAVGHRLLAAGGEPSPAAVAGWLACLGALGALAGVGAGNARIAAIDGGAFTGPEGAEVSATGFVAAVPRRSFGEVRFPLETADGKLLVIAHEPLAPMPVGGGVEVRGELARPEDPFRRAEAARFGATLVLEAGRVSETAAKRGGVNGALDRVRERAQVALGDGLDEGQAALARGFVLGEDDLIDARTREDFNRAGLSHLLAVSGQNVMLLAILAGVILGAFGVRLRARLGLTLLLIAIYVPVAGGGPSIQRAGVMGGAAIVATLAGRPADRAYLPLLAATATLLIDPNFGSDVGWQLSFAAVIGIMLWASSLRDLLAERLTHRLPRRLAGPLAEGAALTIAAMAATAPLMAHHFEQLSLASLPANLLVLPAVAPVMWLGMVISLLGQVPFVPTAPLGAVEGALVDYVAAVARAFSAAGWAQASVPLPSSLAVIAAYLTLALLVGGGLTLGRRRRELFAPRGLALAGAATLLLALAAALLDPRTHPGDPPAATLRITQLDVGQGDAILLQPPRGDPILIDGGPPGGAAAAGLREHGVERLRAIFLTHDDLDHSGGLRDVFESVPVGDLVLARPALKAAAGARSGGARVLRAAEGSSFEFGHLTLDVLWPPRVRVTGEEEDANLASLVLAARFGGYDALLSGDAEAEATHLIPGALDVLKVAHHGSDDAGLEALLARSVPRVALIGVGAENTYGHPTPSTVGTLAEHGVCTLRTDLDGHVTVELGTAGVRVWTESGPPPPDRPGCSAPPGSF